MSIDHHIHQYPRAFLKSFILKIPNGNWTIDSMTSSLTRPTTKELCVCNRWADASISYQSSNSSAAACRRRAAQEPRYVSVEPGPATEAGLTAPYRDNQPGRAGCCSSTCQLCRNSVYVCVRACARVSRWAWLSRLRLTMEPYQRRNCLVLVHSVDLKTVLFWSCFILFLCIDPLRAHTHMHSFWRHSSTSLDVSQITYLHT